MAYSILNSNLTHTVDADDTSSVIVSIGGKKIFGVNRNKNTGEIIGNKSKLALSFLYDPENVDWLVAKFNNNSVTDATTALLIEILIKSANETEDERICRIYLINSGDVSERYIEVKQGGKQKMIDEPTDEDSILIGTANANILKAIIRCEDPDSYFNSQATIWYDDNTNIFKAIYNNTYNKLTIISSEILTITKIKNIENLKKFSITSTNMTYINLDNINTIKYTDMSTMFSSCHVLQEIDLINFNTINVTNMSLMFLSCKTLKALDLSSFNTSNVTNMGWMFSLCGLLTNINLTSFDTTNCIRMSNMFSRCEVIKNINVNNFNTSNVLYMDNMFAGCWILETLDLSMFNTPHITDISYMFSDCYKLTTLYLNNFDTSNVTDMINMFFMCNSLNYIRCKQAFKDWCITNLDIIKLPTAMREGGSGTWDIVP